MFRLRHLTLHHLEWLIGELVPDAEMVVYEVLPGAPVQRDRIIERRCGLAGLDVGQAADDPARAERVRQAFGFRRGGGRSGGTAFAAGAAALQRSDLAGRHSMRPTRHFLG
jgi:hypothetical protein